ncbi:hypothetical protein WM08_07855 [Burkholderia ubonensis]|nr:hypothetical protein WK48_10570 [Burkholderia ubonensis]KWE72377.1 hypothetical protein WL78_10595 [Burkholderia ubonensis]KWI93033.1 hypothetical protein WM08_07855 [Burkholderia ubonensis]
MVSAQSIFLLDRTPLLRAEFPLPSAQQPLKFPNLLHRGGQLRCRDHLFAGTDRRQASVLIELALGEDLVRIHLMATGNPRNRGAGLERLAHDRELLLDRTPAALLGLCQNFDRFYVVVRLKHRQKTTS